MTLKSKYPNPKQFPGCCVSPFLHMECICGIVCRVISISATPTSLYQYSIFMLFTMRDFCWSHPLIYFFFHIFHLRFFSRSIISHFVFASITIQVSLFPQNMLSHSSYYVLSIFHNRPFQL